MQSVVSRSIKRQGVCVETLGSKNNDDAMTIVNTIAHRMIKCEWTQDTWI